jgi:hypothetical protein
MSRTDVLIYKSEKEGPQEQAEAELMKNPEWLRITPP